MTELTIAIAELVRFCHRSGDIDQRFNPSPTGRAGRGRTPAHLLPAARRPTAANMASTTEHQEPGLQLTLRGRADGYDPQQGLVEEIKTCRVPARLHS